MHLQRAWNLYGEFAFEWVVLERIDDTSNLLPAEQWWMDSLRAAQPEFGFNLLPIAGRRTGFHHSEATRAKMATASRGRRHSAETLAEMHQRCGTAQAVSKLTEANVAVIKARLARGERQALLAEEYGVARSTIGEIRRGANWTHVAPASL